MKNKFLKILFTLLSFAIGFLLIVNHPNTLIPVQKYFGESDAFKSFEWWYAQRALPFELIPQGAFEKAANYAKTKIKKEKESYSLSFAIPQWKSLGPYNIGGRVLALAIDPTNPNLIWAGSASGGLWKSTNGGTGAGAWQYVNTGFNTLSVSAIAIDKYSTNTIYIGTGEISYYHRPLIGTPGARASYGMGILKSTDGGNSWSQTGLSWTFPEITAVQKIVINPLNSNTIYAATSEGVFKSIDAGHSWTKSDSILMAMDIVINPNDTTILYVSHGNLNSSPEPGLYKTTNAGTTWFKLINGLPYIDFGRTALTISPTNPSIIYAGISNANSGGLLGLYKSTDGGINWTNISSTNYVGIQGWYDNVIAVHPSNPDSIYCAGLDIYQSIDGGVTLNNISRDIVHVDHHAIAFHPTNSNIVYFGTDGGIFKTTNGGASFINCNYGFQTTQFYPGFANSPQDSTIAIGGLQDNGTLLYTGTNYWSQIFINDGGWCAIDPTNKDIMYFEYQYLNLYKSTNGGMDYFPIMNGLPNGANNTNFIAPFVIAPSSPEIIYAGAKIVYKSTNGGNSWFSPNGQTTFNGTNVACIGVSQINPNYVIAATGTGKYGVVPKFEIFASANGGTLWRNVTYKLNGTDSLPNRYPTDIEFDPTNETTVYLTYSGYGTSHLFKTTNLGETWINISNNLPDIPHQAVCVDPAAPENIYVGTDLGVFHSSDYGNSWEEFNDGMPSAMVLDLTISPSNKKLRASTFGNGVYERNLVRIPKLSLLVPNGGEKWIGDFLETIQWSQRFVETIKIEYSTNNGSDWILIDGNVPASKGSYSWLTPPVATDEARIKISDAISGEPVDSSDATFTMMMNPDYYHGWNLISLHLITSDQRTATIFPTAISKAFKYENNYVDVDTLSNGKGYWLKFAVPEYITINGDSIFSDTIEVKAGWNLIGSISRKISINNIVEIPSNIVTSHYYGYKFSYYAADTILPGKGYWVKSNSNGVLILDANSQYGKILTDLKPDFSLCNSLTFTDNNENSQTIYFTDNDRFNLNKFELPPLPPDGEFDVRFDSQRMLEIYPSDFQNNIEYSINIQSKFKSLKINWNIIDRNYAFSITTNDQNTLDISGSGNANFNLSESRVKLIVSHKTNDNLPEYFTLEQNYPNPFNPSTVIKYQLPVNSLVTLKIYNILGQEVGTLVNGIQDAGYKSVEWQANNVMSGIYFYRIEAVSVNDPSNKFLHVKKMLLLK